MPWSDKGGGRPGGGPWGQGPLGPRPGRGGATPPDLDELLRRGRERFGAWFPGPGHRDRGRFLILLLLLGVAVWLLLGLYRVQTEERAVVLRFGRFVEQTGEGIHYHLPFPIEHVVKVKVTRLNRVEVGYRSATEGNRSETSREVPEESLMLTGDENIVDVHFAVMWVIDNAPDYLFHVQDPEGTVKAVSESVMREIVGRMALQPVLTEARDDIELSAQKMIQHVLDSYGAGIGVRGVTLLRVDPPKEVIAAFRDVQAARADLERQRNEAEAYANDVIPRARGDAAQIEQEGEAYKQKVIARSQGDAQRFLKILAEYRKAPDVTRERLYLETMEDVLGSGAKIVVDPEAGRGVVPYLPLPALSNTPQSVPPKKAAP
jgi:membrane protease subunit HflK